MTVISVIIWGLGGYEFGVLRDPNFYPIRALIIPLITDLVPCSPPNNPAYILGSSAGRQVVFNFRFMYPG